MAGTRIRIDQVLHGYDRGHRELESSVRLDDAARATMLVLSDLLADLSLGSEVSYLSAYPLPSARRHVLARTWPAGPGFRPGSVWTRSLLLDYQALALVADLAALSGLLTPVEQGSRGRFSTPIEIDSEMAGDPGPAFDEAAAAAIAGIYTSAPRRDVVVPTRGNAMDEALGLAVWRQMWPSLRREFALLTAPGSAPDVLAAGCILRFSGRTGAKSPPALDEGQDALLSDLPSPTSTSLRVFLSRYASEARVGRQAAAPLAAFWRRAAGEPLGGPPPAIRALARDFALPRLARDLVTSRLGAARTAADLIALVDHFGDEPVEVELTTLSPLIREMTPAELSRLLSSKSVGPSDRLDSRVAAQVMQDAPAGTLAQAAQGADRAALLRARPELRCEPAFWPEEDERRAALIGELDTQAHFGIDAGMDVFGPTMGVATATALMRREPDPSPRALASLLRAGSPALRLELARWTVSQDATLDGVLRDGNADFTVLVALSDAQVASMRPVVRPKTWIASFERLSASGPIQSASTWIIALTAALRVGDAAAERVATIVYDPLVARVRRYQLTRAEERYLEAMVDGAGSTRLLRLAVARATLAVWSPSGRAGALGISNDPDSIRDLVREAEAAWGREALARIVDRPDLSPEGRQQILQLIEPPKRRSTWWF